MFIHSIFATSIYAQALLLVSVLLEFTAVHSRGALTWRPPVSLPSRSFLPLRGWGISGNTDLIAVTIC